MKTTVEASAPSIAETVNTALGNAFLTGITNRKLETYDTDTLRTHLGLKKGPHCARHALNVGLISALRSGVIGVNVVHGPTYLQSKAQLSAAHAEDVVALMSGLFAVLTRHFVQKKREQASGVLKVEDRSTVLRTWTTTSLTTVLYQKVFLHSVRVANQRNADQDGKLSMKGLLMANSEVVLCGGLTAAVGQFLNNFARHSEIIQARMAHVLKNQGWSALVCRMVPKSALVSATLSTSLHHLLTTGFRHQIHSPLKQQQYEMIEQKVSCFTKQLNLMFKLGEKPRGADKKGAPHDK